MGIYDRDYIKNRRRGGGASVGGPPMLGRVRMLSVTAWLIIINLAVFILQLGLTDVGVSVRMGSEINPKVRSVQVTNVHELPREQAIPRVRARTGSLTTHVGNEYFVPIVGKTPQGLWIEVARTRYVVMDPLAAYGHFSTHTFFKLEVWRLVSFQFLHGGFWHVFFNMFALWIFGPMVEQQLGRQRYLAFYLICGIFGGLMYLLLNLVGVLGVALPGALHVDVYTPLIGASAGVFGVLMACAYIAPKAIVRLLFPPIALELRWFVYGYFALALWNLLTAGNNQGGDAAHIGGALAGFYFIRHSYLLRDFFDIFGDSRKRASSRARSRSSDAEIDRILDKITSEGLQSLSDSERRTLELHSRQERGS